jgi:hypothetical protein
MNPQDQTALNDAYLASVETVTEAASGTLLIDKEYFRLPTKPVDNFVDDICSGFHKVALHKDFSYAAYFLKDDFV